MDTSTLGKIMTALTTIPQYWGLVLDVIEKLTKQQDFARELGRFARREPCWTKQTTITINRGHFDPTEFIGQGGSIATDETDTRSIVLSELDLNKVQFVTMMKGSETYLNGNDKLMRLKESGYIRLDAEIFLTLWENKHLIPESWKERVNGEIRYIFFDGTILRDSSRNRHVIYLGWSGSKWLWNVRYLDDIWYPFGLSAVLES